MFSSPTVLATMEKTNVNMLYSVWLVSASKVKQCEK